MDETQFQKITITHQERPGTNGEMWFRIYVDGQPPHMWTEPGWYKEFADVMGSFSPSLKADLHLHILEQLGEHGTVTFSLKNAYE